MTAIRGSRSFGLIELVIVVVIIGVVAAIALPRMSHGARSAGANALKANLSAFRSAFERYKAEHEGKSPLLNPAQKLTQFSNLAGTETSPTYHFNGSGGVPPGGGPTGHYQSKATR